MAWYRADADGLFIVARLTPRGGRDAIDGALTLADGREVLAVRVRAAPEDGAANAALVECIAKAFGVPKSTVTVTAGAKSRVKQLKIAGHAQKLTAIAAALITH